MSELDGIQSSTKQRRSRKINTADQKNVKQASAPQCPADDNREAWKVYWKEQGKSWRTEQEIDVERQKYLAERKSIIIDIEKGVYPFKNIKLNRGDVEWLLATHEYGRRPVDWNDKSQRERDGLDLRGADLRRVDLSDLPLTRLLGGGSLSWVNGRQASVIEAQSELAAVHLEGANLTNAYLEGASLYGAHLEGAQLTSIHLEDALLANAHLEDTVLVRAHLERAILNRTHLEGAYLRLAHLEGAELWDTHFEGKAVTSNGLDQVQKWNGKFMKNLSPANLTGVFLDEAVLLTDITLGNEQYGWVSLADVRWGGMNVATVDWAQVKMLGDERVARQRTDQFGRLKDRYFRLRDYEEAVRANRQLAVVLRDQGLNEEADHFAYRAQLLQRTVWQLQKRPLKLLLSWFLFLLAGYGYRPLRSLIAYIIIILVFMGLYLLNAHFVAPHLRWDETLVLSISSFHGRGFFTQNVTLGDTYARIAAIEAIVGLFIEISFIATFTQRFFGR